MNGTTDASAVGAPGGRSLRRVWLESLTLVSFRNYAAAKLELGAPSVVLHGRNGSGKTNLLEAVSVLSPGRGLRRAAYEEMARAGAQAAGWTVAARVARALPGGDRGETSVGTGIEAGTAGRKIRIDGTDAAAEELLSVLRVLWLTPAMDGLFTGPEGDRRRFLDRLTMALAPAHGRHATAYEKAMRQRNRLLEEVRPDPAWLEAAEAELARHGAALAAARRDMLEALSARLSAEDDGPGDFPRGALALAGDMEALAAEEAADDPAALEALLRRTWREGRRRDQAAGRTLLGPHRTQLVVTHVDKAMPAHKASTGEQKALLVSLVLAHARLTAESCGEAPVLLLDEVAAHLDPVRRAALFERLDALNAQCFMTGTDAHLFEAIADRALLFEVEAGALRRTG